LAAAGTLDNFFVFDVVEESDDYAAEEQRTNVDRGYDAEKVLVGEQALFETFVQEVGMEHNDLVDCLDLLQLLFKLVVVWLKHFYLHVVHVILAELKHPMAQSIRQL
jgi:hypothetical protein